jgi:hypothetical protein
MEKFKKTIKNYIFVFITSEILIKISSILSIIILALSFSKKFSILKISINKRFNLISILFLISINIISSIFKFIPSNILRIKSKIKIKLLSLFLRKLISIKGEIK